jgi:hypothetical protein
VRLPGSRSLLVLGLISIMSSVAVAAYLQRRDALGSPGAVGIFTGLIAIGISSAIGSVFASRPRSASSPDGPLQLPGLIRLSPKSSLSSDEWLQVLTQAKHEFYVAGHTLGKWCSATHREVFESNIARILKRSGSVRLVLLDLDSPQLERLKRATGTDYSDRVRQSTQVLEVFVGRLSADERSRLTISILKDHMALPYMVVGNERTLITATYLASRDSDEVPCLELDRLSDAAIAIYDDFCKLADQGDRAHLELDSAEPDPDPPSARMGE